MLREAVERCRTLATAADSEFDAERLRQHARALEIRATEQSGRVVRRSATDIEVLAVDKHDFWDSLGMDGRN
jgi:hypothetical protein